MRLSWVSMRWSYVYPSSARKKCTKGRKGCNIAYLDAFSYKVETVTRRKNGKIWVFGNFELSFAKKLSFNWAQFCSKCPQKKPALLQQRRRPEMSARSSYVACCAACPAVNWLLLADLLHVDRRRRSCGVCVCVCVCKIWIDRQV